MHLILFEIENAAIDAILEETPDLSEVVKQQMTKVKSFSRSNTGGGFFLDFEVGQDVEVLHCVGPLGKNVHANVQGLEQGMGFLLWFKNGRLEALEGYSFSEETRHIAFESVDFQIVTNA